MVSAIAFLLVPRRWAALPLLAGACYMTIGQEIDLGPFHFTILRVLVAVGVVRVFVRGERLAGKLNGMDHVMLVWAAWTLMSSAFHKDPSSALIFRLGLVYNTCGIYFLIRIFSRSIDDVFTLSKLTAILLLSITCFPYSAASRIYPRFERAGFVPSAPLRIQYWQGP